MDIVAMVAMSHSPSWDLQSLEGPAEPYVEAVFRARDRIASLAPDVIVVFGPDHVRNFFFDLMPAFSIGVEEVTGFGDYSSPKGPMPTAPKLAAGIAQSIAERGFDPALSYRMGVDHGVTQPYAALVPGLDVPMIPVVVSSAGPPLPSLRRCHAFGEALGAALREQPGNGRVVIVGSGGMSHSPPSISPADPALTPDMRDYVIAGRDRVAAFNAAREQSSLERRREGRTGPIDEAWDRWFLDVIRSGDLEPILALSNDELLARGGVGGQELRSWLAALGAWGGPVSKIDYAPVPTWITGMGCIAAYEGEAHRE